ncbi:MAG TPA: NAD(P)-dependent oxidoreductase [Actinomycetota bacterium]|nr:NAD(P)-dependent oxidoreductase [Actinomycetota bacterium]
MKVAVLGTGRMGGAMVGTLTRAGFDVVVWNRDRAKADAVVSGSGAPVASSPADAVREAEVVISSLADDAAVEAVFEEAVKGLHAPQVVLEMSTIAPSTIRTTAERVAATGATVLDAPVSWSVSLVEAGQLTIMVGGDPDARERARPVLEALSAKLLPVGPLGAGATMKLAVNALVHGLNAALAESLVLAERAGVDRTTAYEVFASGAAGAPFVQYKRAAYEQPDETPVAFSLDLVGKDLDLILQLADEVAAPMPQATVNREGVRAAIAAGMGSDDLSALAVHLRAIAERP